MLSAQDFTYAHFDTRDGLAGSTVYDICQDKDGFIWFGTENGLSRYDGTRFQNFTVKDGLPDNEVLYLHADKKGRIWIGTFSRVICYFLNGRIYTPQNDTLLRKFQLTASLRSVLELEDGTLYFGDGNQVYELKTNNQYRNISNLPAFQQHRFPVLFMSPQMLGHQLIMASLDSVFMFANDTLRYWKARKMTAASDSVSVNVEKNKVLVLPQKTSILREVVEQNKATFVASTFGAWEVDTLSYTLGNQYLKDKVVTDVLHDVEQNTWFATLGSGVYKLASRETRTMGFHPSGQAENAEVFSIMWHRNKLYCGLSLSEVSVLDKHLKEVRRLNLKNKTMEVFNNIVTNRLFCSLSVSDSVAFLGFDAYLVRLTGENGIEYAPMSAIKSISRVDNQHILVGNAFGAYKMRIHDMQVTDTLWHSRVTKAAYFEGKYYIGTTDGLYALTDPEKPRDLGSVHPVLERRITGMAVKDGILWIASGDMGIVGLRQDKVVLALEEKDGLSSNICKAIYAGPQALWVGTNRGLNRIEIRQGKPVIMKIGVLDGLPSDNITSLLVIDSMVYVGTPKGLSFFNKVKIGSHSICNLRLLETLLPPEGYIENGTCFLPYRDNSIRFNLAGISARSAGQIDYYYRLKGLQEEWEVRKTASVEYPSLPPGDYVFEIYAVNRFGVQSNLISVPVVVAVPFWQTPWFIVSAVLLVVFLSGAWFRLQNAAQQKKIREKAAGEKRLAELEQQALQAQMNPHFIFNCLNSIQQYFLSNDGERANKFLSMFATLVRETLHFSGQKTVRISDEVRYLKRYLELEQMRFGNQFDFRIEVALDVQPDYTELPALLLQPYVENAIRHGIRHKLNGKGHIFIGFSLEGERLQCIVRDNGVGRRQTMAMKSKQAIEYQSKGMELGQKRIDALNRLHDEQISIDIIDLYTSSGEPEGTEVRINIPV